MPESVNTESYSKEVIPKAVMTTDLSIEELDRNIEENLAKAKEITERLKKTRLRKST